MFFLPLWSPSPDWVRCGRGSRWRAFLCLSRGRCLRRRDGEGGASPHFTVSSAAGSLKLDQWSTQNKSQGWKDPLQWFSKICRGVDTWMKLSRYQIRLVGTGENYPHPGHFNSLCNPVQIKKKKTGQSPRVVRLWFLIKGHVLESHITSCQWASGDQLLCLQALPSRDRLSISCLDWSLGSLAHLHLHTCWQPTSWPCRSSVLMSNGPEFHSELDPQEGWNIAWNWDSWVCYLWIHVSHWLSPRGCKHTTAWAFAGLNPPDLPRSPGGSTDALSSPDQTSSWG